jgi:hypothetical protein
MLPKRNHIDHTSGSVKAVNIEQIIYNKIGAAINKIITVTVT